MDIDDNDDIAIHTWDRYGIDGLAITVDGTKFDEDDEKIVSSSTKFERQDDDIYISIIQTKSGGRRYEFKSKLDKNVLLMVLDKLFEKREVA